MKVNKLTLTAVVPTAQYANLQPTIEVEVDGDYEAAKAEAIKRITEFSQEFAEDGKALGGNTTTVRKLRKMVPYIGDTDLFFDSAAHAYCDDTGAVYTSGSLFAKQFEQPFPEDIIIPVYAKKFSVTEAEVKAFWRSKATASTTFGTALHQALETHGKYAELAKTFHTEVKPVTTGIHPTLLPIVEAFFDKNRLKETAVYEPFVSDSKGKRCGQIDRLVIVDQDKMICDIEDYKTNADLYKQNTPKNLKAPYDKLPNQPISGYTIQLNFYRATVEANGWTVRNMKIHHWDGEKWATILVDKVQI